MTEKKIFFLILLFLNFRLDVRKYSKLKISKYLPQRIQSCKEVTIFQVLDRFCDIVLSVGTESQPPC